MKWLINITFSFAQRSIHIHQGILKGFDQTINLILMDCQERVFYPDAAPELHQLGLYLLRGENIATVGQVDTDKESEIDLDSLRGEQLKPVVH